MPLQVNHQGNQPSVTISFNLAPGFSLGQAVDAIHQVEREARIPASITTGFQGSAASGILGSAKDLASGDTVYTSRLSVKSQPWLSDHVIYGTVVVPGATYAAMALAAVGPVCPSGWPTSRPAPEG